MPGKLIDDSIDRIDKIFVSLNCRTIIIYTYPIINYYLKLPICAYQKSQRSSHLTIVLRRPLLCLENYILLVPQLQQTRV